MPSMLCYEVARIIAESFANASYVICKSNNIDVKVVFCDVNNILPRKNSLNVYNNFFFRGKCSMTYKNSQMRKFHLILKYLRIFNAFVNSNMPLAIIDFRCNRKNCHNRCMRFGSAKMWNLSDLNRLHVYTLLRTAGCETIEGGGGGVGGG